MHTRIRQMSTGALEASLYMHTEVIGVACLIELLAREGMPSVYAHYAAVQDWHKVSSGLLHWRELL